MTKNLITLSLISMLAFSLQAQDKKIPKHSCKNLEKACIAAGYTKGKHTDNKSLKKNCVKPLLAGETVEGMTITAEEIDNCKMELKKIKKAGKKSMKREMIKEGAQENRN